MPPEELGASLASGLPQGLSIDSVARRTTGGSVASDAEAAEYVIRGIPGLDALGPAGVGERIAALMAAPSAVSVRGRANREAGGGPPAEAAGREFVPAREILVLAPLPGEAGALRVILRLPPASFVRPSDLVRLLAVPGAGPVELALVRRKALLRRKPSAPGGLEAIS
jgi:hypothetical protein